VTREKIDDDPATTYTARESGVSFAKGHRLAGAQVLDFREAVIKFLKEHPGYLCAECLASSLGVPVHPTTMITLGLQRAEGFETSHGVCSRCQRLIRVIKAEGKT